ncbi:MAG: 50S ribosomal protein L23 [bacterium]
MSLIMKPVITEKSLTQVGSGVYTFMVPMTANKLTVAQAVKAQFKVDATDVRISVSKGKVKRTKQIKGRRVDKKKAFVQLAKGQKIAAFDMGQEEVKTTVRKKDDKKVEKKTSAKVEAK